MFDAEKAFAFWRAEMTALGVDAGEVLDELESHLRDEFDVQLRTGKEPPAAFEIACRRIGRPETLGREFARNATLFDALKRGFLTFASIPNHNLATNMNTTRIEPAWATYLKGVTFLAPGIFLTLLSAIFVVPKFQQICRDAGLPEAMAGTFWKLVHSSIQLVLGIAHQGLFVLIGTIGLLMLLEWRFTAWAHYRKAAVGCAAFTLNALLLIALFIMFMAAIMAAPELGRIAR